MNARRQFLRLLLLVGALLAGCVAPDPKVPERKSRNAEREQREKEEYLRAQEQRPVRSMDNMGR